MNKKHFLLTLPVCLVFCLWLTTCEEKYEQVDNLWEKLRNTVWENDNTPVIPTIIGFYGPRNGPYNDNNPHVVVGPYKDLDNTPYVVVIEDNHKYFSLGLSFDRTGNEIRFPDMTDENGKNHTRANIISLSDDGEKLTVKNVKKPDWGVLPLGKYTKKSSDPIYDWGRMQLDNWE